MSRKKLIIIYIVIVLAILIISYPIGQAYVSKYNRGNDLYNNGDYENAEKEYESALKYWVLPKHDCMIRINYALAICKQVYVDEKNRESIEDAINTYETAKTLLTENKCETHNNEALQLKEDIEKEIERLKKLLDEEENDQTDDEEKKEDSKKQDDIKQKIQNIKEEAIKDQRESEMKFTKHDYTYMPSGKTW